jgi:hypothetical protein
VVEEDASKSGDLIDVHASSAATLHDLASNVGIPHLTEFTTRRY